MAIPTYDQLFSPLLKLACEKEITRKTATDAMIHQFKLTEDETKRRIPSGGSTYIYNRTGWAMTFLTKGGLIKKVARAIYKATSFGEEFLARHPDGIRNADLREIEGWKDAWKSTPKKKGSTDPADERELSESETPEEQIDNATATITESLRSDLLEQLLTVDPFRFEQIVIDLLFAMGYGGSREEATQVTQKSNDEGVDGLINEDRLGLDVIYVQAKRWQNSIGRKEIQSFVGALAGKQANKGIFITTSDFRQNAIDYAKSVAQKVILIDGHRLADLMIEHNTGVTTIRTIAMKRIDSDYFED